MTQTTIYLSVIHGDESLTLDGSLHLFNELFEVINNATKGLPQTSSNPTASAGDVTTPKPGEILQKAEPNLETP